MGYPLQMIKRKRTTARIEAEKRYAPDRPKKPVSFRLSDDEMAQLDKARGARSRGQVALEAMLDWIRRNTK
jgi:hypothetical protein